MRAVIWCAVSSKAQIGEDKISLDEQERLCRKWCVDNGHDVVAVLKIEGHSRFESKIEKALAEFRKNGVVAYEELAKMWTKKNFDVLIAIHPSRFGRSNTLVTYIIENTLRANADVYITQQIGWIKKDTASLGIAMSGISATSDVTRLVIARDAAMTERAKRGLPPSQTILGYKILRTELGKAIRLQIDESKRRLWDDLATLLLEGIGYKELEQELYERFGHTSDQGEPYRTLGMYDLLHNPVFWGNTARHHRGSSKSDNGQKKGFWIFDDNEPLPEGVVCFYGTHEPIYTGDVAERVKAELRRRGLEIKGTNRPYRTEHFSGLMICGECGYTLVYNASKGAPLYRCNTMHWQTSRDSDCQQRRGISLWRIQRWLDIQLEQMLKEDNPAIFMPSQADEETILKERIQHLTTEIEASQAGIARLIRKQAVIDDVSLEAAYDEQIMALNREVKGLQESLALAQKSLPNPDVKSNQVKTFSEIKLMSLDNFWDLSSVEVNQMLHRLFAKNRLVVLDGQIVGIHYMK